MPEPWALRPTCQPVAQMSHVASGHAVAGPDRNLNGTLAIGPRKCTGKKFGGYSDGYILYSWLHSYAFVCANKVRIPQQKPFLGLCACVAPTFTRRRRPV